MIMEDFGPRVLSVWEDLRATTRKLVQTAWSTPVGTPTAPGARSGPYDPRVDSELSRLLAALDERAGETGLASSTGDAPAGRARRLADACADMLTLQTQSAEVFSQLIQRAHAQRDFARIDQLADAIARRLAPSELCEMARSNNVVVRALAQEALTQMPAALLTSLLADPVDSAMARLTLERQAGEFASEEAKRALREFEQFHLEDF